MSDLYFFSDVVLGYGPKIPMSAQEHLLMTRFVEKKTGNTLLDTAPRRLILVPREVGKSTLITQAYTIQCICQDRETSIMIANEKEGNSKLFLSEIKRQFESNELLRALFPELIPPSFQDTTWSATQIVVNREAGRKEPTVFVIGEGGTVTGMHPDKIIVDDIISRESMENARVGDGSIMQQVNRWINQLEMLLSSNALPFPEIVFCGTRWWTGDTYEHIETTFGHGEQKQYVALRAKGSDGMVHDMPIAGCYRVGDLAIFRRAGYEDGKVAFPTKWPATRMAKVRVEDPGLFATNIQNDPSDEAVAVFRISWLRYFIWLDERAVQFTDMGGKKRIMRTRDLDIMMFVDPGGFGANADDRMRAAIVVTGSTGSGEHLILEAWSERDTFMAAINQVIAFASTYGPRKVVVEVAGQQAAFVELLKQTATKTGTVLSLTTEKPGTKAKANRILELEPYLQQGHLYVSRGPNMAEFMEQIQRFPRTMRVDLLDALAYGPRFWKREHGGTMRVEERRAQELASYWERRGGRHA